MQGQGDAMGSLSETLDLDHASSSSSAAMSHQLYWNNNLRGLSETQLSSLMLPLPEDSSIHSRLNWPGSSLVECSSSSSSRPVIGVPECKMVNEWPSSVGFSGGSVPHLDNWHQSVNIGEFALGSVDANQLQLQHPNYGRNPPSLSLDGDLIRDSAPIVCPGDQVADVNGISRIVQQQFTGGRVGSLSLIGVPECKMVNEWPSSVGFSGGSVPRLENWHQSANIGEFALGGVDANQLQLQHPNYGCNPPSLSLDGGLISDSAPIVCPRDQVADVNGNSRIVQQQFTGGRVGSSDVRLRHVPCKRKSLDGHIGQSSTVPSSFLSIGGVPLQQQTEPRLQQPPVIQEPGTMSGHVPSFCVQGSAEDSLRNSRLRTISSSPTSFSRGVALQNSVASSSQASGFMSVNHPVDSHSLSMSSYVAAHRPPVVLNIPASAYTRNSSTSVFSCNAGGSTHNLASSSRNTRNDLGHPVFVPVNGSRPLFQNPVTRSVPDANGALPGNAVYSPGNGSIPSVPPISQSSHPNMVPLDPVRYARYLQSRRLSEYVRQALLASSGPVTGGATSQVLHGFGYPTTGLVNQGHRPSSSRSLPSTGRRADSVAGVPNSRHRASLVDERRRRLVELRSAVELMRSGQGVRLEDIMCLHPSAFLGIADLHDRHRNLRLDVDNMSYEELLALEECIGNVSTGLNEETILGRLKQRKFVAVATCGAEVEPCCICQEEYAVGDEVGTLDCGHEYHTCCIKQWLTHKNSCPICKTTGLAT